MGRVFSARVPPAAGKELNDYLRAFLTVEQDLTGAAALTALWLYIRWPLAAVLLGHTSAGVLLLPLTAAAFGCSLSFSVCCFTAAFGTGGTLLAAAVFGLRCLISLPCFFLLAVPVWESNVGAGRRTAPFRDHRAYRLCLIGCAAVLSAGALLETVCAPWLTRMALNLVLT